MAAELQQTHFTIEGCDETLLAAKVRLEREPERTEELRDILRSDDLLEYLGNSTFRPSKRLRDFAAGI